MVFYGHFQGCADNRLVALELPKIDVGGAVHLVDFAGALDEHPAFRIPLDSPASNAWRASGSRGQSERPISLFFSS